jgi:DNA-binding PucR family transcriptional regulator
VYAALPASVGAGTAAATVASARRLADRLGRHAVVGFSSFHSDPTELSTALQEAELVLDVLNNSGAPVGDEIEGGTYKLLFRMLASHPEEILSFYQVTIEAVVRYDAQYRTELIRTLEAYLEANCNMNATATAIFAHRHTVAYRLDRIRDLTGLDPMLSDHRERLGLGLKVHRIVAPRMPLDAPGPSRRAVESRTAGSA